MPPTSRRAIPRYDAREVAGAGAAESGRRARGRQRHAAAGELAGAAAARAARARRRHGRCPPVEVLDMRAASRGAGPLHARTRRGARRDRATRRARRSCSSTAAAGRRFLSCRSCGRGWSARSATSRSSSTRAARRLRCHHCGHAEALPASCPDCGSVTLARHGAGTERWRSCSARRVRRCRCSAWTPTAPRAARRPSRDPAAVRARRTSGVLVGTQMVAQGPRLPGRRAERGPGRRRHAAVPRLPGRGAHLRARRPARRAQRPRASAAGGSSSRRWLPTRRAIRHAAAHDAGGLPRGRARAPPRALATRPSPTWSGSSSLRPSRRRAQRAAETARGRLAELLPPDVELLGPAPRFRLRGQAPPPAPAQGAASARRSVAAVRGVVDGLARGSEPARSLAARRRRPAIELAAASRLETMSERAETATIRDGEPVEPEGPSDERAPELDEADARAPRRGAQPHPQVRRPGPQVAGLRDHARFGPELEREAERMVGDHARRDRRRARRHPARRDAPAARLPGRPRRDRRRRSPTPSSSGCRTRSRPPRRAASACPRVAVDVERPLYARVRGRRRRTASRSCRGVGARGPRPPARDRPPRRRADARPHRRASSARRRCARCARARSTARPRGARGRGAAAPARRVEGRLPGHLGVRRGGAAAPRGLAAPARARRHAARPPARPRPPGRPAAGGRRPRELGLELLQTESVNRARRRRARSAPPRPSGASSAPSAS